MSIDAAFTTFPKLTTKRLRLRQLQPGDAEALFTIRSDPQVREPYGREPYQTLAESQAFIKTIQASYEQRDGLFWAITLDADDTLIGSCTYWNFGDEFRCVEVGYELGRAHWGRGIMTEAVGAIVAYGFDELELHRIEANPHANNMASKRLLQKLGFTHEGTLRERAYYHGHFDDQEYYGLLGREWRKQAQTPQPTPDAQAIQRDAADTGEIVDEASEESFPASDPPAWTGTTLASNRYDTAEQ